MVPVQSLTCTDSATLQELKSAVAKHPPCHIVAAYMMKQKLGPPADDSEGSDASEDSGDASSSSDAEVG